MNNQELLRALQAGQISLEDVEKQLAQKKKAASDQSPTPKTGVNPVPAVLVMQVPEKQSGGGFCQSTADKESMAIIGISGRYPEANNLDQYWNNLISGRNSIREVPKSRWDVNQYYDPRPAQSGKVYCKWLGVLDDIEAFDPLFFNISPAEAESMDPQHRIFLEEGYRAFEDAGYNCQLLNNKKCGVYLGIMSNEYGVLLSQIPGALSTTSNSFAIAAARLPYFLNLKGPAIPIDTACSSSLVAAHLACQALLNHEIDMALVGGVTLYLTAEAYIGMCSTGMLSPDGQCKTFDNSADGFVPGEGVGAMVLKRLKDAEADHDHIYGVIIGSGINQDGKTNGITAPSVNSQMELERGIYQKYQIHPDSISYVEMHGTGTKLGDPIELEALATVYKENTKRKHFCGIGSVKSNIGHTSAASGVASIQKVLLSMQHQQLAPTLNFKQHNEHFDFENSPFYVNTESRPWETTPGTPRRAGVSSFGFSGTNAHLIIEEYLPPKGITSTVAINVNNPALFVLSAQSEAQLKTYAESVKCWIEAHEDTNLADLSYTLQVGREAMDYRLAFLTDSRAALLKTLKGFVDNYTGAGVLVNQVKKGKGGTGVFEADEDAKALLKNWVQKKKLRKIAELWVNGLNFDWDQLYDSFKPRRISLPTYPFAKESYWIPDLYTKKGGIAAGLSLATALHPLLQQNTSDLTEQRFSSTFTGQEFFLADHRVNGQRILPGVAYLEMARAAVEMATGASKQGQIGIRLKNVIWVRPLTVADQPVVLNIGLYPENNGEIAYEIYGEPRVGGVTEDIEALVYSQGNVMLNTITEVPGLDLSALQALCNRNTLSSAQCYDAFRAIGIEYGPGQQGIKQVYVGAGQILAKLALPSAVSATEDQFVLHPSLMDSALQSSLGLMMGDGNSQAPLTPFLPFAMEELEVFGKCTATMWAWIRSSEIGPDGRAGNRSGTSIRLQKLDIDISDSHGMIQIRIKGYSTRALETEASPSGSLVMTPPQTSEAPTGSDSSGLLNKTQAALIHMASVLLNVKIADIDAGGELAEYGFDPVKLNELADLLNREYLLELEPAIFFEYPTIHRFAEYLVEKYRERLEKRFEATAPGITAIIEIKKAQPAMAADLFRDKAVNYFKKLLATIIKLPPQRIAGDAPLEKYGIDSIMVLQLTNQLEKTFGSLPKTLFFEYQTIDELTGYFLEAYGGQLIELLGIETQAANTMDFDSTVITEPLIPAINSRRRPRFASLSSAPGGMEFRSEKGALDIAIIGVSGHYPKARNVQEFWQNLRDGRDCITEIPEDRWDHSLYFDEDKDQPGKTYSKWGGFLDGVDQFDPLFFNISPREAEIMDPQERLFLQCVYETLEDAGYTRNLVEHQGLSNVGVYVGVMYEEYQLYGAQEQAQGRPIALPGNAASIANRVSYFCNFRGPSVTMDTMCSSSLTAIHFACQSILGGSCEVAIAGGVNLSIHPNKYLLLGQGKFVSSKGRCESFGKGGDGYVPGEGVGAVLLKPLSRAIADGDHIYGVIKGTAINHGGKTNGYSVPNPNAQAEVIGQALKEAGIDPRTISYIEAHGTGTSLGDPIEIAGLTKAFSEYTKDKQFCAIGSVKSNIGHCESAAGIAGITKVLLQLKNGQLAPSLHSEILNPHIDFSNTPFVVPQTMMEWKRPVVTINGVTREYPKMAGISSFGAGGSNAHVIIAEYPAQPQRQLRNTISKKNPAIIVLSAKNVERLREQAGRLMSAIGEQQFTDSSLADIAYTLQVGREAMEERLVMMVGSLPELMEKLQEFLEGREDIAECYRGQVKRNQGVLAVFTADEDLLKAVDAWITKGKYGKLLELWVNGLIFDWNKLYGGLKPFRVSLPAYPFAKESYWVPEAEPKIGGLKAGTVSAAYIHPLLHRNTSDFSEQRFSSTFTGREFFLASHVINGQRLLPGVVSLEMARAAVEVALGTMTGGNCRGRNTLILKNVVWSRPVVVGTEPVELHIGLFPEDNGEITYEIYGSPPEYGLSPRDGESKVGAGPVVYNQGNAVVTPVIEVSAVDLKAIQTQCTLNIVSTNELYEAFKTIGFEYGPANRGVEQVFVGQGQVLAKLSLPASVSGTKDQFVLHPSIMDSALQAALVLMKEPTDLGLFSGKSLKPALPFAVAELEIISGCSSVMWALIRYSETGGNPPANGRVLKLDLDLYDKQGNICVRLKELSTRVLEGEMIPAGSSATIGKLYLEPIWNEQAGAGEFAMPVYDQLLVMICEPITGQASVHFREKIETRMNGIAPIIRCLSLQTKGKGIAERFQDYAFQAFEEVQTLLKDKSKGKVLVQIVVATQTEQQLYSGLSGLLRTAQLENPKFIGQLIEVDRMNDVAEITIKLMEDSGRPGDIMIRYQDGRRYVKSWSEMKVSGEGPSLPAAGTIPWRVGGVYLITGGAGGLGLIFAAEIARQVKEPVLILTGRSRLIPEKQAKLKELEVMGAKVIYRQADVADKKNVTGLIQSIREEFGSLNGILHSAGVTRDNFIIKKTKDELLEVLAPKVYGLVNLDEASQDLSLDFFVLFSSGAGCLGNIGQADYSTGNAFMDAYAKYRNVLVASGQRQGKTISINWPLWKEGGMGLDRATEQMMVQSTGMLPLETTSGLRAFYQSLALGTDQVMVLEGNLNQIRTLFFGQMVDPKAVNSSTTLQKARPASISGVEPDGLREKAIHYFKKLLSSILKLPAQRIEADAPLEKYGIDSVMITQLTQQLEKTFGTLSKTLFFEYQTIQELTGYFLEAYRDQLVKLLGIEATVAVTLEYEIKAMAEPAMLAPGSHHRSRFKSQSSTSGRRMETTGALDIAIIGVSGRYPQARNLREFWTNLSNGRDCITEIPLERWDHSRYYSEDRGQSGKTHSKWGGFMEGVDQFDPLFFNISPREAEIMDPQERLFLECVYETLEDAGYTRETLGSYQEFGLEGNVGVYVGVMYEEYQLYGAQEQLQGRPIALAGNPASIANRVSYFFNLHGPSMAIDTMCSSSLTAIHLACQSLQKSGCELAIAGGVNCSIHPNKYLTLSQGKFVSSKGRCESFGRGGDGYVPGEGVGAVLLKPLAKAIADGDHIYGVIKGTAINHGGKTNGYTVPNPNAQAEVIGRVLKEAGIDPRTISYIEAHGTGTSLGDPIEIAGLTKTFAGYTKDKQFCAIGSVKSNIGHCESAAGVAAVTKVLLQIQNGQLAPSLHSEVLNPNIDFRNTPFVVQQALTEWKRPEVEINGVTREYPRRAGISAFGAGGSNAHVIIEEYIPSQEQSQLAATSLNQATPVIVLLSAKNEVRLKEQAQRLLAALEERSFTDSGLANLAYTLQVGRESMEERLAMIVLSVNQLAEKLRDFVANRDDIADLYRGQARSNKEALSVFTADEELQEAVIKWIQRGKYTKLLDLWVKGMAFDWNKLYGDSKPRRISLPAYPFARESYWFPERQEIPGTGPKTRDTDNTGLADSIEYLPDGELTIIYPEKIPSSIQQIRDYIASQALPAQAVKIEGNPQMIVMEELLAQLLWGQMQSIGWFGDGQSSVKQSEIADLKTKTGIRDMYDRWLEETMAALARKHYLQFNEDAWVAIDPAPMDINAAWLEWERQKGSWLADPNLKAQVILVEATMRALPEILTGKRPATDVMFPNSSMELVEGIYKHNLIADYFNEVLTDTLALYIQERLKQDPSARIRLLEIGAGTGGTSAGIFRKLAPYRDQIAEYCYTDISKAFLMYAQREFGPQNPYLTYQIYNVEAPLAGQAINAGGYDIVIAANVLHATRNIRQTIRNAKAVLQNNGLILINEVSSNALYTHLTFGLLGGWWLYEDPELRIPGCPALDWQTWQEVLEAEGFRAILFPARAVHQLGQQIVVAESNGVVRQEQQARPGITPLNNPSTIGDKDGAESKTINPLQGLEAGLAPLAFIKNKELLTRFLKKQIAALLKINESEINDEHSLTDFGLDSILMLELRNQINKQLKTDFSIEQFIESIYLNKIVAVLQYQLAVDAVIVTGELSPDTLDDQEVTVI